MVAASVHCPVNPPSASISLTICPLPIPPIEGLQLITASLVMSVVTSSVFAPKREAAYAASQPACPPPIMIISISFIKQRKCFLAKNTTTAYEPCMSLPFFLRYMHEE